MAEAIFFHLADQAGVLDQFEIDSAGTGGWHQGELPDHRTAKVLKSKGIPLNSRARKVVPQDFETFDLLLPMDRTNLRDLISFGAPEASTRLMLTYSSQASVVDVPDPYYGDLSDFEHVYDLLVPACEGLLNNFAKI